MPTGVYIRTKKYREIMSEIAKKHGYGKWMVGKKDSEITKEKKRQANYKRKEKFGYYHTKDGLNKLRRKKNGRHINCLKCGKEIWVPRCDLKDRKFCSQSCASSYFRREIAKHWRGGIGSERHVAMSRLEYSRWRELVFIRDNFTCQECGKKGGRLNAHHIKLWREYPKLRYKINNGITLCKKCHQLIHKIKKKK